MTDFHTKLSYYGQVFANMRFAQAHRAFCSVALKWLLPEHEVSSTSSIVANIC